MFLLFFLLRPSDLNIYTSFCAFFVSLFCYASQPFFNSISFLLFSSAVNAMFHAIPFYNSPFRTLVYMPFCADPLSLSVFFSASASVGAVHFSNSPPIYLFSLLSVCVFSLLSVITSAPVSFVDVVKLLFIKKMYFHSESSCHASSAILTYSDIVHFQTTLRRP